MKRENYISWDEYFMGIALLAAQRSKDPGTQVGACIVSPENIIISTGYNGFPNGCSDDEFPWAREGEDTKYPYVVHAELNAILNAGGRVLRGGAAVCGPVPLQRVCQGHHPERHPGDYLPVGQVRRHPGQPGLQTDAGRGGGGLPSAAD